MKVLSSEDLQHIAAGNLSTIAATTLTFTTIGFVGGYYFTQEIPGTLIFVVPALIIGFTLPMMFDPEFHKEWQANFAPLH